MPVPKTSQLARLYLLQNSLLKFPIFENRKIYVYIYVYTCLSSHLLYDCFDKISAQLSFTSAQICWSLPPVPAFVLSSENVNRSFYWGGLFIIHPMKASPPTHTSITQCDISGYHHHWVIHFGCHHCVKYFFLSVVTSNLCFCCLKFLRIFCEDQFYEREKIITKISLCFFLCSDTVLFCCYLFGENMKVLGGGSPQTYFPPIPHWEYLGGGIWENLYRSIFPAVLSHHSLRKRMNKTFSWYKNISRPKI